MPFKKGQSGKPKGTENRAKIASDKIKEIIEAELGQIPEIISKLDDEKRLEMLIKLLPYVAPKLSTQTVSVDAKVERNLPSWFFEGD